MPLLPDNPGIPPEEPPSTGPAPVRLRDTTETIPGGFIPGGVSATKATIAGQGGPDPISFPTATLGHYRILEPIARGGMGTVLKAFHTGLERTYALKVIQADPQNPGVAVERFLREARAVARVGKHPNIVQVHDVGQQGPFYYLAMDLVEGQTLDQQLRGKPLPGRRAAEIARKVAEGLEVAHAAGIIHRDLKPSNILMTREGSPQITDFGLARDISADSHLSQDGQILGTLQYMAPEQAAGEQARIGPATDVYGLGATLYEMIAGKAPFEGPTQFAIWSSVMAGDPRPPRTVNPNVHPDLETICMKAMSRSPADRYAGAAAMAEDLRRFLDGEPILARPASWASTVWKLARRRWPVVVPTVAAVVLCGAWATGAAMTRMSTLRAVEVDLAVAREFRAKERPREARDAYQRAKTRDAMNREARDGFAWASEEVDRIDREAAEAKDRAVAAEAAAREMVRKAGLVQNVLARWVRVSPAVAELERIRYDSRRSIDDIRAAAAPHWAKVAAALDRTPKDPTSQATMLAFAGWARSLAGYDDEGLAWMRRAHETDPDLPYGVLMEALCCLSAYLARQPLPQVSAGPKGVGFGPMPAESADMRVQRIRMSQLLDTAAEAKVWGEGIAEDFRRAIRALQALQEGKYEEADAGLTEVIGTAAMIDFENDALFARGKARYLLKRFDEGIADLQQVVEARPAEAEARVFLGQVRIGAAAAMSARGEDPRPAYVEAIAELGRALDLRHDGPDALSLRGIARLWGAEADRDRGADPGAGYDGAIADFEAAIKQSPEDGGFHLDRGNAYLMKGRWEASQGQDCRWAVQQAIEAYGASIARDADHADTYAIRGGAFAVLADVLVSRAEDPSPVFDKAIADFGDALKRDPENLTALCNRGHTFERRGSFKASLGQDPREDFELAIHDASEALRRDASQTQALLNRASAATGMGDALEDRSEDGVASYDAAIADLDIAIQRDPSHLGAYNNRGSAWQKKADTLVARGKDPGDAFDRAIADLGRVVETNPKMWQGYSNRGIVKMSKGRVEVAAGRDAKATFEAALADFDKARSINDKAWMATANRGLVLELLGRYAEAVDAFDAAIALVGKKYPKLNGWRDRAKAEAEGKPPK